MLERFFAHLLLAPFKAWVVMITVGAVQPVWDYIPAIGYTQTLVLYIVGAAVGAWYDSTDTPAFTDFVVSLVNTFFVMLVMGMLHGTWEWIPALGFWQIALITLPFLVLTTLAVLVIKGIGAAQKASDRLFEAY